MERKTIWCRRFAGAGLILAVVSTSGCVTEWVPRTNAAEYSYSTDYCSTESRGQWPVKNEVAVRTVYVEQLEKCREDDKSKCDVDGKYNRVQQPQIESYVMDVNESSRSSAYKSCMWYWGWSEQERWLWQRKSETAR
ncbi:MAG: hypothetical protein ACN6PX_05115 [Stenotrophomonas lactitubi]